jgi:hypothetical protein
MKVDGSGAVINRQRFCQSKIRNPQSAIAPPFAPTVRAV